MGSGFGGGFGNDYGFGGGYGYQPDVGTAAGEAGEILGIVFGVIGGIFLIMMVLLILTYVLQSLAMYTIAKRRMINNPWLAWVPYGNSWMLGSISDQYQYVAKGKVRNRRKVLLGLAIALAAISFLYDIMYIAFIVQAVFDEILASSLGWMIAMLVFSMAALVVSVVQTVFYYIALYDLYSSCDPDNNLTYLLLSIFLSITTPFLMFACRKHDRGMPPRKVQPQALPEQTPPVAESEAPVVVETPESEVPAAEEPTNE